MIQELMWQASLDGVNWHDMPSPSSYDYDFEDVDNDSYRSVVTASIIRSRIAKNFTKFTLEYSFISAEDVAKIMSVIKVNDKYYFRGMCPMTGNNWIQFAAYTSKINGKMLEGQIGYTMKFSIIQSQRESFND